MTDTKITLEQCSLHTEAPETAKRAPEQIEAALKRGALVIGFTEVHPRKMDLDKVAELCQKYGYEWLHAEGDSALAYKNSKSAKCLSAGVLPTVGGRVLAFVRLEVGDEQITVVESHFSTASFGLDTRLAQAERVASFVVTEAAGAHLAFWMGDTNSDFERENDPIKFRLNSHGLVSAQEALDQYDPTHGEATGDVVGYFKGDTRVSVESVETLPRLGSDHHPVSATFAVKPRQHKRTQHHHRR